MSEKIKTSVGVFTVGELYKRYNDVVMITGEVEDVASCEVIPVRSIKMPGLKGVDPRSLEEMPTEFNGGKIEPVPWEPKLNDGLYQLSDNENFKIYIIDQVSKINDGRYVDKSSARWKYCRPVPEELRVFGE